MSNGDTIVNVNIEAGSGSSLAALSSWILLNRLIKELTDAGIITFEQEQKIYLDASNTALDMSDEADSDANRGFLRDCSNLIAHAGGLGDDQ